MKFSHLLVAVLAASSFAVQAVDIGSAPSVGDRLSNARKAIQAKDWSRTLFELSAAEREEPNNADIQNLLGYSWRKRAQPNLAKAIAEYKAKN